MKHIDIIRPSSINAINGPIGTLKRILANKEFFNKQGYDVTLFVNESISHGPYKEVPASSLTGAITHLSGLKQKISIWLRYKARTESWAAILIDKRSRRQPKRLVEYYLSLNRSPDIIQFHSDEECYFYLKENKGPRPKIVLFQHNDGIPFRMHIESLPGLKNTRYIKNLQEQKKWMLTQIDRVVFIAKVGQKNFLSYYPRWTFEDTSVIINGIDKLSSIQQEQVVRIKSQAHTVRYRFCCTGTISFRKGQHIILEALTKLSNTVRSEIRIDFIGDGAERLSLEHYAEENGIAAQVRFLGSVPNAEVYKRLSESNIYILMSNNEGLPISIIEAMRVGLPIISTKVSGIPELINEGYNGFLLNPDADELASLLNKLDEYDWEEMGENSKKRFEKEFTFERMMKELCDMYNKTLQLNI